MANSKISALTAASALVGTEAIPVVQGGVTLKLTPAQIKAFVSAGGTVVTSNPVLDLTQTWNSGGVTFTGLKFNVTDTASAAGSLLADLQVNTVTKFSVDKAGAGVFAGNLSSSGNLYLPGGGFGVVWNGNTFLTRRATASIQLGAADTAAPVAQTFGVQGVVAGTLNTAGANFTIAGSQGTGTGAGGSLIFQVSPAGGSGSTQNALATALTIDSTKLATFGGGINAAGDINLGNGYALISPTKGRISFGVANNILLQNSAATDFGLLQGGGTTSAFPAWKRSGVNWEARLADDTARTGLVVGSIDAAGNIISGGFLKSASYTVGTVPSASAAGAGAQIYVSNESGGAVTAFSDATNWRRVTDRAVIS